MPVCKCHLVGCTAVVVVNGDSAAFADSVNGRKVFFCRLEHWQHWEKIHRPREPMQLSLPLPPPAEKPVFNS